MKSTNGKELKTMCKLFDKNQVYNTRAISEIFFDMNPNRFSDLRSCQTRIANQATLLEAKGMVAPINQQKKNRVYSGIHAELICESLCKKVETDESKQELPLLTQMTIPYDGEVAEETEFSDWIFVGTKSRKHDKDILISIQKSKGKERIAFRFNPDAYQIIFGNRNTVSLCTLKKYPSLIFIVPGEVRGCPHWTLTPSGKSYVFSIQVSGQERGLLLRNFVGDYNVGELVQKGVISPGGTRVKAWGFKAKS